MIMSLLNNIYNKIDHEQIKLETVEKFFDDNNFEFYEETYDNDIFYSMITNETIINQNEFNGKQTYSIGNYYFTKKDY